MEAPPIRALYHPMVSSKRNEGDDKGIRRAAATNGESHTSHLSASQLASIKQAYLGKAALAAPSDAPITSRQNAQSGQSNSQSVRCQDSPPCATTVFLDKNGGSAEEKEILPEVGPCHNIKRSKDRDTHFDKKYDIQTMHSDEEKKTHLCYSFVFCTISNSIERSQCHRSYF